MSDVDVVAFLYPSAGMNGAGLSNRLPVSQYRRATNVCIDDELPTTRPGVRIHALTNETENSGAAEFVRVNNVQGAMFFNPAKGQGGLILGKDQSQIALAAGGRKYSIVVDGVGPLTTAKVKDISGAVVTSSLLQLVWWKAAENYALAQDGSSNAFIYNAATGETTQSTGYDSTEKEKSKLPNGGTVMAHAHGRVLAVVNSRQILVGDAIHKSDQSSAVNMLGFTEQVYWATGQYFLPPSAMGNILAADILPLRNTQHGHGDVLFHCEDGVFSIDINQTPRTEWPNRQLVKHAILQAGAVGPYAVALRDGDQIYRTRHGITTLRSAAADSDVEGNPQTPLSEPVATLFERDVPEWLRFCSVVCWEAHRRLLVTVDPCIDGRFRWHSGIVVRNFNPMPAERSAATWEGMWTLPPQAVGIVQLVGGMFNGRERMFAIARGEDGNNRLVEFTTDLEHDVLEDGTVRPIRCQLITRAVDFDRPFKDKEFVSGSIFLRDVRGDLTWGVWVRAHGKTKWEFWNGGTIKQPVAVGASGMERVEPLSPGIPLGNFPKSCLTGQGRTRSFEFLIRWKGFAKIESLRVMVRDGDDNAEVVDMAKFAITGSDAVAGGYSDFEYSSEDDWTNDLKK